MDSCGVEALFAVVAMKLNFVPRTMQLEPTDGTIECGGRIIFVDSKNHDWLIFSEDFEWELSFKVGNFEWVGSSNYTVRLYDMVLIGDLKQFQNDLLLFKITYSDEIPDQSLMN